MTTYHVTYRGLATGKIDTVAHAGETILEIIRDSVMLELVCAIPTSGPKPVRHAPRKPKRYGGLIEGAMIAPTHPDRYGRVCRIIDSVDSATPPLRRNDLVALQSGGLLPHEILAKAKQ
jgi:hypothetical protein